MEKVNNLTKYIVYCVTCKVNGKIYIGVHKTSNPNVFDGYIGNGIEVGWTIKNPHTAYQNALKKYGYSNFQRNTLYVFDSPEEAYNKEAEIVTLDFVKSKDNYNTALGGIHPGTTYKSIYQYDLNGKFIKEWWSITEAYNYYGCYSNRFNMAIKDKRSAFNSYWSDKKVDILDISEYRKSMHSEIYQYDLEGNFIKYYDHIKDILKEYDFKLNTLKGCVSRKTPIGGYYFISDFTNIYDLIKTREMIKNVSDNSVSAYDSNGNLVCIYSSIKDASKQTKLSESFIKKEIKNKTGKWSYGYAKKYMPITEKVGVKIAQYDLKGNFIKYYDSISQCCKEHPHIRAVLNHERNQTHGYKFEIVE